MGGNVSVNGFKAEPLTIAMRQHRMIEIIDMLESINFEVAPDGTPHLPWMTYTTFSGSTEHYMNHWMTDSRLSKYKSTFGDVDIISPVEYEKEIINVLDDGHRHGNFVVVGSKKLPGQLSVLMQHRDDHKIHQFDFEFKAFVNGRPSPWAKMSQNQHESDLVAGIKGAAHKALILATTAKEGSACRGVIETTNQKGTSYSVEQTVRRYTFSQIHGLRFKHIPQYDHAGWPRQIDGVNVYTEATPSNTLYFTDLNDIVERLFDRFSSDAADIINLHSFIGVVCLMKQYMTPRQQINTIEAFINSLFDKKAATHFSKDSFEDLRLKNVAIDHLRGEFPEAFDNHTDEVIKTLVEKYYAVPKPEEQTIAFIGGRFNGPTCEHDQLILRLLEQPADRRYVAVYGPKTVDKTTARDPLTVDEKIEMFRALYPAHADMFVSSNNPVQALAQIWHDNKDNANKTNLIVVAGEGTDGVVKDAGGSIDEYKDIIRRTNVKSRPELGGMHYSDVKYVGNPRGKVSGTVFRAFANSIDLNNPEEIDQLRQLMVPGITRPLALSIATRIQERTNANKK